MRNDELMHYGVLGMRWGVRRYQNKDGSYTDIGRRRRIAASRLRNASKTKEKVDEIIDSLSRDEKDLFGLRPDEDVYLTMEQGEWVIKRFLKEHGNKPVAFLDVLRNGDDVEVALAVNSNARGKGFGGDVAKMGADWLKKNKHLYDKAIWAPREDNTASRHLAEKNGFARNEAGDYEKDGHNWLLYEMQGSD